MINGRKNIQYEENILFYNGRCYMLGFYAVGGSL